MARENIPLENRYHVQILDESGATIPLANLTRTEFDDFRQGHIDDDLDYSYRYGPFVPGTR